MHDVQIRLATSDDLAAINDIYNYYVVHSTCTAQTEPEPIDARQAWFDHHGASHPVTVGLADGVVLGWGSLSPFHSRCAYARSVENSVYIHHKHHRRGIGRAILSDLLDRAAALGHHTVIAGISADQLASLALHERAGFVRVGCIRESMWKFDRWLDLVYMQKMVGGASSGA
jgi:L-amino acid N-acyltransferase YncA